MVDYVNNLGGFGGTCFYKLVFNLQGNIISWIFQD